MSKSRSKSTMKEPIPGANGKTWLHSPEQLTNQQVTYKAKLLGRSEVDGPKGSDFVQSAIQKLKFEKTLKKAEGIKPRKVELVVCIKGVAIVDAKTGSVLYNYPLHHISYCADDKSDKRMFALIGRQTDSNQHFCYVFDSDKCAEELTLTVGQAFDLGFKKFLGDSHKNVEAKGRLVQMARKVQSLEDENRILRDRVNDLESKLDAEKYLPAAPPSIQPQAAPSSVHPVEFPALQPPPAVPRRRDRQFTSPIEHLHGSGDSASMPPPVIAETQNGFGPDHGAESLMQDLQEWADQRDGFSAGMQVGHDDFSIADLDPLKNK